jgi:hypothetical protein
MASGTILRMLGNSYRENRNAPVTLSNDKRSR